MGIIFVVGTTKNLHLAQDRHEQRALLRRAGSLALPALVAGLAIAAAYAPSMISGFTGWERFLDTPPTPLFNLSFVWTQYFADGFWGWPAAAFILAGLWRAVAQAAPIRFLLPPLLLGPVFMSLQGRSFFPWTCARYFVFTVPLLLLFAAYGISWPVPQKRNRLWTLALATLIAASWTPHTIREFSRKIYFPWHQVRAHLTAAGGPDSLVIGLDWGTNFQLDPRPDPPTYKRVPIGKLQPAEFEGLGRDRQSDSVFVVLNQINPPLPREAVQFGLLTVLKYRPSGYREFLEALRGDLAALVARLPTEPEYAPLYDALVEIARRLGDQRDIEMYLELSRAAGSRTLQSREATELMLKIDADRVAERWRKRKLDR